MMAVGSAERQVAADIRRPHRHRAARPDRPALESGLLGTALRAAGFTAPI